MYCQFILKIQCFILRRCCSMHKLWFGSFLSLGSWSNIIPMSHFCVSNFLFSGIYFNIHNVITTKTTDVDFFLICWKFSLYKQNSSHISCALHTCSTNSYSATQILQQWLNNVTKCKTKLCRHHLKHLKSRVLHLFLIQLQNNPSLGWHLKQHCWIEKLHMHI